VDVERILNRDQSKVAECAERASDLFLRLRAQRRACPSSKQIKFRQSLLARQYAHLLTCLDDSQLNKICIELEKRFDTGPKTNRYVDKRLCSLRCKDRPYKYNSSV
jgi:hypothetical protein